MLEGEKILKGNIGKNYVISIKKVSFFLLYQQNWYPAKYLQGKNLSFFREREKTLIEGIYLSHSTYILSFYILIASFMHMIFFEHRTNFILFVLCFIFIIQYIVVMKII